MIIGILHILLKRWFDSTTEYIDIPYIAVLTSLLAAGAIFLTNLKVCSKPFQMMVTFFACKFFFFFFLN